MHHRFSTAAAAVLFTLVGACARPTPVSTAPIASGEPTAASPPPLASSPASTSSSVAVTKLSADEADPLANPPKFESDAGTVTPDIEAALDVARAKLKTLPRYAFWRTDKFRYDTVVTIDDHQHVRVLFDTPDVTDQEVIVVVDPTTKTVVQVMMGMA